MRDKKKTLAHDCAEMNATRIRIERSNPCRNSHTRYQEPGDIGQMQGGRRAVQNFTYLEAEDLKRSINSCI